MIDRNLGIHDNNYYNLIKKKLNGYNIQLVKTIWQYNSYKSTSPFQTSPWIRFREVSLEPINYKIRPYSSIQQARQKIVTPEVFKNINSTLPFWDYSLSFYELREKSHFEFGPFITEKCNDWNARCKAMFNESLILCLQPVIYYDFPIIEVINGKSERVMIPNPTLLIELHTLVLELCNDLKAIGIDISLIIPPENGIDDAISATFDSYKDKDEEWKNELDGFIEDYNSSMDEETDGFWSFQNNDN